MYSYSAEHSTEDSGDSRHDPVKAQPLVVQEQGISPASCAERSAERSEAHYKMSGIMLV